MFNIQISLQPATTAGRRSTTRWAWIAAAASVAAVPVIATAAPLVIPNLFEDGAIIEADTFNENFDAIAEAVDDNDTRIGALEGGAAGAPSGAVMFFNLSACPEGWNELEEARGRSVVGMDGSAATLLGEVGTALGDLAPVMHSHTIGAGATVSTNSVSAPHTHASGTFGTDTGGSHNHQWRDGLSSYDSAGALLSFPAVALQLGGIEHVNFGITAEIFTDNDGSHSHDVSGESASSSSTSHSHSVDLAGVGVSTSTSSLPYLQLLACERV